MTRHLHLAAIACLLLSAQADAQALARGAFRGRSLVLVSIDTLRADRLGAYGYRRPTSPGIDRLAGESLLFEHCYSHSPKTAESHMSLMTGVLPTAHGVVNWSTKGSTHSSRPEGLTTLAALLKGAGYRTQAYTSGGNVGGRLGFEHGFDAYVEAGDSSLTLGRLGLEELARSPQPFFLFVHTYAVHDPYTPAPEDARLFVDPAYSGRIVSDKGRLSADLGPEPSWWAIHGAYWDRVNARDARDVRHVSDLYDASIHGMDAELRPLIESFRRLLGDQAIFVLVSDHGEEFGEHGSFTHNSLFQEVLHVPLVMRLPGVAPRRLSESVGLSDVMPTLLDLLGLATPDHVQARSLLPLVAGAEPRGRPVVSEWLQDDQAGIRLGDLKYIRGRQELLFDLRDDPAEKRNLLPAGKDRLYPLRLGLDRFSEASFSLKARFGTGKAPELDPETRRQLEALGYIGP